jgi:hypothetical protein
VLTNPYHVDGLTQALEHPEAGAFGPRRVPAGEPLTLRPVAESASNVCG